MRERGYDEEARVFVNTVRDLHNHLKKAEPDDYQDRTLKSKEFADVIEFARKRFIWQDGSYTVELQLRIAGIKDPTEQQFQFVLTKDDVERLRQNLDEIEKAARDLVRLPEGTPSYVWNWAYPPFTNAKLPAKRTKWFSLFSSRSSS